MPDIIRSGKIDLSQNEENKGAVFGTACDVGINR